MISRAAKALRSEARGVNPPENRVVIRYAVPTRFTPKTNGNGNHIAQRSFGCRFSCKRTAYTNRRMLPRCECCSATADTSPEADPSTSAAYGQWNYFLTLDLTSVCEMVIIINTTGIRLGSTADPFRIDRVYSRIDRTTSQSRQKQFCLLTSSATAAEKPRAAIARAVSQVPARHVARNVCRAAYCGRFAGSLAWPWPANGAGQMPVIVCAGAQSNS